MKTQLILSLYDSLVQGEKIDRQNFCTKNAISERTFYRYIREISLFLMHSRHNAVLKMDDIDSIYYLELIND